MAEQRRKEKASLPQITLKVIPNSEQRYPTCGDYFKSDEGMEFRVSKMNWKYEFLVALHELIEWALIHDKGVAIEDIDAFDIQFEKEREEGNRDKHAEPGDDPSAPYYMEHQIATSVEQAVAHFLKVDWKDYDRTVGEL